MPPRAGGFGGVVPPNVSRDGGAAPPRARGFGEPGAPGGGSPPSEKAVPPNVSACSPMAHRVSAWQRPGPFRINKREPDADVAINTRPPVVTEPN